MRTFLLIGLSALAACHLWAQSGPTFDSKRVVSYGPDDMPVAETAVAVDPNDSDNVVAMWNIYNGSGGRVWMGCAVSCDGGATWDDRDSSNDYLLLPVPGACNDSGHADPGLVFNPNPSAGQGEPDVIASGLVPCGGPEASIIVCEMTASGGDVCGDEFGSPTKLTEGNYTSCFTDFPHIAAGPLGEGWGLYIVGNTRAALCNPPAKSILQFHSLTDWSEGWSERESIEIDSEGVEGSYAVAACGAGDGRLDVAYTHKPANEPLQIFMVYSDDGGATWSDASPEESYFLSGDPNDVLPGDIWPHIEMLGVAVDPLDSDVVYIVFHDLAEAVSPGADGDLNPDFPDGS